jgi:hypothetical protein
MANKVFNVDQLRLGGNLLTGNVGGELFYQGIKLANGDSAVPLTRTITLAGGVSYSDGTDSKSLATNLTLQVNVDNSTIGVNGADAIYVKTGGVNWNQLHADVAGPGLGGGHTSNLYVNAGSGIQVSNDQVHVKPLGIETSMIKADAVTNDQLAQITEVGKIQGGAVTLHGTTLATGSTKGLMIKAGGVGLDEISTNIAGNGLQGGGGSKIDIVPAFGSGIAVSSTEIGVGLLGVTNAMLAGSITNGKLEDITTTNKVYGGAVRHDSTLGVTSNNLHIASQGVNVNQLHSNVAGNGINGGNGAQLTADPGSGIVVNTNGINIGPTGVLTSMIKDGQVTNAKLAGSIDSSKLNLVGGSGLVLNGNDMDAGAGDGINVTANAISVDSTVVRTNATQTLDGNYTFNNAVTFETGILVKGDLTVKGQTILLDSNTVNIGDNIIVLNADYAGTEAAAVDAGIEIERGQATNNAYILFDDYQSDVWKIGTAPANAADPSASLYQVHSAEFTRSYSAEISSGVCYYHLPFAHTFSSLPNVTVSLEHTGKYSINNPDLLHAMVTGLYTTGVHVAFSANTPASGYFLHANVSSVGTRTVLS